MGNKGINRTVKKCKGRNETEQDAKEIDETGQVGKERAIKENQTIKLKLQNS